MKGKELAKLAMQYEDFDFEFLLLMDLEHSQM